MTKKSLPRKSVRKKWKKISEIAKIKLTDEVLSQTKPLMVSASNSKIIS